MDVKLRSWARAEDMALLMDSSARETCAWRKSLAARICGVRRDVRFFVVDVDDDVVVIVLPLLLLLKDEEGGGEEDEGGRVRVGRRDGGFDWRCRVGKSS